jgi:hypothetical protein
MVWKCPLSIEFSKFNLHHPLSSTREPWNCELRSFYLSICRPFLQKGSKLCKIKESVASSVSLALIFIPKDTPLCRSCPLSLMMGNSSGTTDDYGVQSSIFIARQPRTVTPGTVNLSGFHLSMCRHYSQNGSKNIYSDDLTFDYYFI